MFKNLYNEIDFFFRRNIRLKRNYSGKNESKDNLFEHYSGEERETAEVKEKFYLEKYHLQEFKENSTRYNYLENLAVIELLESCFLSPPPCTPSRDTPKAIHYESNCYNKQNPIKILDIGSKNWFYATGEWSFFKYNFCEQSEMTNDEWIASSQSPRNDNREIFLDGIEIDAFRVYSDFHTRYDYAQFYIKNLENTRYIPKDFLKHKEKYDYIVWFFPFVTEFPLKEWGLPLRTFKPSEMLKHAYDCLNEGGKILIVNQDEKEYAVQQDLLRDLNFHYEKKGDFKNSFLEYERKRFVTMIFKDS